MKELASPRHERFAQEIATGATADAAYEKAGYKRDRHHASRLATNGNVRARVAVLQAQASRRAVVTLETLLACADEARAAAMDAGQHAAAIAAIKEIGILFGPRREARNEAGFGGIDHRRRARGDHSGRAAARRWRQA